VTLKNTGHFIIFYTYCTRWWRGCAIGRALDLLFAGRGFESWLGTIA